MEEEKGGDHQIAKAASGDSGEQPARPVYRKAPSVDELNRRIDDMQQNNWQFTRKTVQRVLRRYST